MEDEVISIEIDSFDKLSIVDFSMVGKTLAAIDIRNLSNAELEHFMHSQPTKEKN